MLNIYNFKFFKFCATNIEKYFIRRSFFIKKLASFSIVLFAQMCLWQITMLLRRLDIIDI